MPSLRHANRTANVKANRLVPGFPKRRLWMASIHQKEKVCAVAFSRGLGLLPRATEGIDTDQLGTFCGQISRPAPASEVVVAKAKLSLRGDCVNDLALASEASFSPHPSFPFVPLHQEILVLVDGARQISWLEVGSTLRTNFAQHVVHNSQEQRGWAEKMGFPGHALMVSRDDGPWLKGIQRWADLPAHFPQTLATDMRAHLNPTRCSLIRRLSMQLVLRLRTPCPSCQGPGFGVVDRRRGLPCSGCGYPTSWILACLWRCEWCQHLEQRQRPDGIKNADPAHCDVCNP